MYQANTNPQKAIKSEYIKVAKNIARHKEG